MDNLVYDASDGTFKAIGSITGTNWDIGLTEGTTIYLGRWKGSISSTPIAQFSDGQYIGAVHDASDSNKSLAAGEVYFKAGDEVHLDIAPSQNIGYDADATVHAKLGGFDGGTDNVKDKLADLGGNNILLSVAPGEYQIISNIGQVGQTVPSSFAFAVLHEHAWRVDFTVKKLDGTSINLTNTRVRFLVQDSAGDGQTIRIDINTTTDPSKINFSDAANGKFYIELTRSDTNISVTGGDGAGSYYAEILWDQNLNGEYKAFAVGRFNVQAAGDILAG